VALRGASAQAQRPLARLQDVGTPHLSEVRGSHRIEPNYSAHLDKRPLDPPGSSQITAPITVAGDYAKTLIVDDASGKPMATVTKAFAVRRRPGRPGDDTGVPETDREVASGPLVSGHVRGLVCTFVRA
jgi:hypothetical protein